jgi:hypothetical protein
LYITLGLNISIDLKWNFHVSEPTKKAAPRFYFLRQLKRAAIPTKELLKFYTTCIRATLNVHAQFITTRYPSTYQTTLKGLQKIPLRIIYPWMPYTDSLEESGLPRLFE